MHRILLRSLAGSALLVFSLAACAQSAVEQVRSPVFSQDEYQLAHSMFDKVRIDLSRAETNASPSNGPGDSPRFDIARTQLGTLEQSWDQARFDSRQMSDTISAIEMVLRDNRLLGHDGDELSADVSRLLDFQITYY
jgi:hypothetical protein